MDVYFYEISHVWTHFSIIFIVLVWDICFNTFYNLVNYLILPGVLIKNSWMRLILDF